MIAGSTLQKIFNAAPTPTLLLLPDTPRFTILTANAAYLQATGYTAEALAGKGLFEVINENNREKMPDSFSALYHSLTTVIATRESHKVQVKHWDIPANGQHLTEEKYWEAENLALLTDDGKIEHIIHHLKDITELVKAKISRSESIAKYKSIHENSLNALFISHKSGIILEVNQAACDLFGYTEQEFKKINRSIIIEGQDCGTEIERSESKEPALIKGELTGIKKNGDRFSVEHSSVLFTDINGEVKSSTIIYDISDRKKATEKILQLNRIYAFISQINEAITRTTESKQLLEEVCRIAIQTGQFKMAWFGFLQSDGAVNIITFCGEEDGFFDAIKKIATDEGPTAIVMQTGATYCCNDVMNDGFMAPWRDEAISRGFYASIGLPVKKLGITVGVFTLYAGTAGFFDEQEIDLLNNVAMDISFALDVFENESARLHTEEKLVQNERRYRTLVENGADAVVLISAERIILYANKSLEKVLGYPENDAMGLDIHQIIHPDDHKAVDIKLRKCLQQPGIAIALPHVRTRHKNGQWIWLEVTLNNMLHDPVIGGIVKNFRDVTARINAEEALKNSQEQYKLLFQHSPMPSWIYNQLTYQIIDVNETAISHYGYSKEVFLEMTVKDISPSNEIDKLLEAHKNIGSKTGIIQLGMFNQLKQNGSVIQVEVSGYQFEQQQKKHMLVVCNDVTEKENALKRALDNETKLLTAQQIARLGYWQYQISDKSLYWTDEVYNIWDVIRKDFNLTYTSFFNTIHPDDQAAFAIKRAAAFSGEITLDSEHRIITGSGTIKWVHEKGKLVYNSSGVAILFEGTVQDITTSKLLELRLYESNQRYNYVSKATFDAVWDWNLKTNYIFWGEGFTTNFGYQPDKMITYNKYWEELIHPKDRERVVNSITEVIKSGLNWVSEYRFKKSDDSYAFVLDRGFVVKNKECIPQRMVGAMQDITRQKADETEKKHLAEVVRLFNEPWPLKKILEQVLENLFDEDDYAFSEVWLTGPDSEYINLTAKLARTALMKKFYSDTAALTQVTKGMGLAGFTWQQKTLQVWHNHEKFNHFKRKDAIVNAGITSVLGIPLISKSEFIGVLVAGFGNKQKINEQHINLFKSVGSTLSGEINRKQMELELACLFSTAPDIICTAGMDGFFKKINPAACDLLEFSEEELLLRPFSERVHSDDRNKTVQEVKSMRNGRETSYFENRYITKSGKIKWLGWSSTPIPDEQIIVAVGKDITEKKNLEELLNKSNRLAQIGSWEIDVINNTVYWSDITKEIREADPDFKPELSKGIGLFKDESRDIISQRVKDCIEYGTPWDEELQIITQKGNPKWVRTIGEAEIVNGKCIRVYGSFQDIDARKWGQIELMQVYQEKNSILESIGDAFFAVDKNWIVTYWNKEAEKILNTPKANIVGKNLWTEFADEIGSTSHYFYNKALIENTVQHFEAYYPTLAAWFEINAYPSSTGLSVFFKDITERKQSVEKIRQSNERFEKVSEATSDAIWDWDLLTGHIFRGEGFRKLFGHDISGKELQTFGWDEFIHPDDREIVFESLQQVINHPSQNFWQYHYRYCKADGGYAFVTDRGSVIRNEEGKAIRIIGAMTDVTHQREYEQSLKQLNSNLEKVNTELGISNKELEQFAYVASHDLQEPLRMITSFLSQLQKKYKGQLDDKAQQYIHFAVDGAQRMRQIILDLLEFSKTGRVNDEPENVDVAILMEELKLLYRSKIEETNAIVELIDLPVIQTYKIPVRQVLQNLLSNALKYQAPGTNARVSISCMDEDIHWKFTVSDNGIGIEAEYFEKIFVIFQRLHNKDDYSGTGIGLAICKKIVENMGGKIWVSSEEGKGSSFHFTILKP